MTLKPSNFATRQEALAYVNTQLDEWRERFRELEEDLVSLSESPIFEEVQSIKNKWEGRAADLQGVKT